MMLFWFASFNISRDDYPPIFQFSFLCYPLVLWHHVWSLPTMYAVWWPSGKYKLCVHHHTNKMQPANFLDLSSRGDSRTNCPACTLENMDETERRDFVACLQDHHSLHFSYYKLHLVLRPKAIHYFPQIGERLLRSTHKATTAIEYIGQKDTEQNRMDSD